MVKKEKRINRDYWDYALKNNMKVGDIIYPHYNGTAVWYKKSRWDVIIQISETKIEVSCLYDYSSVKAIETMQKLNKIKGSKQ